MKLMILDRDGVINHDRHDYVKNAAEWVAIDGSLEAIAALSQRGWIVVVASNQSGLGRGYFGIDDLLAMQAKMNTQLAALGGRIDALFFCPHTPEDQCQCRKPLPGMMQDILARFHVNPAQAYLVGDSWRDLQAAVQVGIQPILVTTGNGLKTLQRPDFPSDIPVYENLQQCVTTLLEQDL